MNSSSRKSPGSDNQLPDPDSEFEHTLPVELADAAWLKDLCRSFYAKGFARGWSRGVHDAIGSSIVNDSRIVRPAEVQFIQDIGGKGNG